MHSSAIAFKNFFVSGIDINLRGTFEHSPLNIRSRVSLVNLEGPHGSASGTNYMVMDYSFEVNLASYLAITISKIMIYDPEVQTHLHR